MTQEKRKSARVTLDVPASLSLYLMDITCSGLLANVSEGGCFFPVDGILPVGEKCRITFSIGEGLQSQTITLSGKIIRSDNNGVGIEFDENCTGHYRLLNSCR